MESYFPLPPEDQQSQLARAQVLADIRALMGDGEILLMATANDLSRTAKQVRERLFAMLARARMFISETQHDPIQSARIVIAKTGSTVRKYPVTSLAVAFGTGLCLGALLTRKSRD